MGGGVSSDYVDFDLPSGLLWAKKNLGAETEEDAGLYFQWGDTQGYTAEQVGNGEGLKRFVLDDYKFSISGSGSNFSKYNSTDGKTVLDLEDDAVHAMLGGNWRMPTQNDFHELINNTDLYLVPESGEEIKGNLTGTNDKIEFDQQTTRNIKGIKFYKKNDSSVYMLVPAAGYVRRGSFQQVGEYGVLWSSSLYSQIVKHAWLFDFNAVTGRGGVGFMYRYYGHPLRGVSTK